MIKKIWEFRHNNKRSVAKRGLWLGEAQGYVPKGRNQIMSKNFKINEGHCLYFLVH